MDLTILFFLCACCTFRTSMSSLGSIMGGTGGDWLRGPEFWVDLLEEWSNVAGQWELTSEAFPDGCAHWYVPAGCGTAEFGRDEAGLGGSRLVTFIRGHVEKAEDWRLGWSGSRLSCEDGIPFKRVRIRFHHTGGACIVSCAPCPSWFEEGFMPEVAPGLSRRLDIMFHLWSRRQDASVRDGGDTSSSDESETTQSSGKKRKTGDVTPQYTVKEEEVG